MLNKKEFLTMMGDLIFTHKFNQDQVLDFVDKTSVEAAVDLMKDIVAENDRREKNSLAPLSCKSSFRQKSRTTLAKYKRIVEERRLEEMEREVEEAHKRGFKATPKQISKLVIDSAGLYKCSEADMMIGLRFLSDLSEKQIDESEKR